MFQTQTGYHQYFKLWETWQWWYNWVSYIIMIQQPLSNTNLWGHEATEKAGMMK